MQINLITAKSITEPEPDHRGIPESIQI